MVVVGRGESCCHKNKIEEKVVDDAHKEDVEATNGGEYDVLKLLILLMI